MCRFCDEFGDGGKWYLNPANYARRLYKIRKPEEESLGVDADPQAAGMGGAVINDIIRARAAGRLDEEERVKKEALDQAYKRHFAQVVTLEETKQIFDIAFPIARMTCACRRASVALPDEQNFTCIGIGSGMYKWERWPETYRGGVEFMSPAEAKRWADIADEAGLVHTVDVFGLPYIGGMCQCEYPGCVAIRNRLDYDFKFILKGEYVAEIDPEKCIGCKKCIPRCHFRAMFFKVYADKAGINMMKCFGCGLCASVCPTGAITLVERSAFPALAENW